MRSVTIFHKDTMALTDIYKPYMVGNLQRNKTKVYTLDGRLCGLTMQYKVKLCRTDQVGRTARPVHKQPVSRIHSNRLSDP